MRRGKPFEYCVLIVIVMLSMGVGVWIGKTVFVGGEGHYTETEIFQGSDFRNVTIYDTDGNVELWEKDMGRQTLVFYEKPGCSACLDSLPQIKRIIEMVYSVMDVRILWQGSVPLYEVEQAGIKRAMNYTVSDDLLVAMYSPCYYILDENQKIKLKSDDLKDILKYAVSALSEDDKILLKKQAVQYINEHYFADSEGVHILYFSMEGCKDCKAVEEIVGELADSYPMQMIYTETSTKEEIEKDYHSLLAAIFNLDWYPSFLIINGDKYQLVGRTKPEELEQTIVSIVETFR